MRKKDRHIPEKHGLHLHAGCRPQPLDATPLPAMAWEAAPHAQPHGLVQRTTRSSHFLATHTNYNYLYILPHWRTAGLHGPLAVRHGQTGPCRPDRSTHALPLARPRSLHADGRTGGKACSAPRAAGPSRNASPPNGARLAHRRPRRHTRPQAPASPFRKRDSPARRGDRSDSRYSRRHRRAVRPDGSRPGKINR